MLRTASVLFLASLITFPAAAVPARVMRPMFRVAKEIPRTDSHIRGERVARGFSKLKKHRAKPWLSSSGLAVTPDGRWLVVPDADNDAIAVIDARTMALKHTVKAPGRPERAVAGPDGTAWVTCRLGRAVVQLDPRNGVVLRRVPAGVEPYSLALDHDGKRLLVTSSATAEVLEIDAAAGKVTRRLTTPTPWPSAIAVDPTRDRAYVTHLQDARVDVVDLKLLSLAGHMTLPSKPGGAERLVLSQFRGRTVNDVNDSRHATGATAATVSPDGGRLWVAHLSIDTGEHGGFNPSGGYGMNQTQPILTTVTTFDLKTQTPVEPPIEYTMSRSASFANTMNLNRTLSQPAALVAHPKVSALWLTATGSDIVTAFDTTATDTMADVRAYLETGHAPTGLALSPAGDAMYVQESHAFSVRKVDLAPYLEALPDQGPHARPIHQGTLAGKALAYGTDPLPPKLADGRRLFTYARDHRVSGRMFACASCHPGGRNDGLTWHVGEGPRQTPLLTGRLKDTGPYNWLGSEDELTHNIVNTIKRLSGAGLPAKDLDALAAYIQDGLPGVDNPNAPSPKLVAEGKAIFDDDAVGCSGCHQTAEGFTDGLVHDLGTSTDGEKKIHDALVASKRREAGPIRYNTPSLKHLWASAPYYHHGGASDLVALVTTGNPGDRMGKTSHLKPGQVQALVAYLKTL